MKPRALQSPAAVLVAIAFAFGVQSASAVPVFTVGGSYDAMLVNFPTPDFPGFSLDTVTLDETTKSINGGQVDLIEEITPDGPNTEWIEFTFSRQAPLAGDLDGFWGVFLDLIPVNGPVRLTGGFFYWTTDGEAEEIVQFDAGLFDIPPVIPNPIDPSRGDVYGVLGDLGGPFNLLNGFAFLDPYSILSAGAGGQGEMDPQLVNDFHFAIRATLLLPAPGTLGLMAIGLLALGVSARRRMQTA